MFVAGGICLLRRKAAFIAKGSSARIRGAKRGGIFADGLSPVDRCWLHLQFAGLKLYGNGKEEVLFSGLASRLGEQRCYCLVEQDLVDATGPQGRCYSGF